MNESRSCRRAAMVGALTLLCVVATVSSAAIIEIDLSAAAAVAGNAGSPPLHLARFDLPGHLADADIDLAVVEFCADVDCEAEVGGITLNAYLVTEDWEAGLVDWDGFHRGGNEPFDRSLRAMWGTAAGDSTLVRLDVTEMVALWADGSTTNRGLALIPATGDQAAFRPALAGAGRGRSARLTIWYTPLASP